MRPRRYVHDAARLAFAALGTAPIAYMVAYSNVFAIALLFGVVLVRREERGRLFEAVRGAVTLYIAITGVVFALLLAASF